MPLVADAAIVTAAQVAAVTHESRLTETDEGDATLAALLPEATNALIRWVRRRGLDPATVSNEAEMRAAASYWVMWSYFRGLPQGDDEVTRKTELYQDAYESELQGLVVTTTNDDASTVSRRGRPRVLNWDAAPSVMNPRDNRRDGQTRHWQTK